MCCLFYESLDLDWIVVGIGLKNLDDGEWRGIIRGVLLSIARRCRSYHLYVRNVWRSRDEQLGEGEGEGLQSREGQCRSGVSNLLISFVRRCSRE